MKQPSKNGFTLVELLVAMAILGIVLTALMSLTTGTLRLSSLTSSVSASLGDVANAESYLTDTMRNAKMVLSTVVMLNPNGTTLANCNNLAIDGEAGRCIAALIPVVDTSLAGQPIVNFDLSLFAMRPIGSLFENEGIPRGWQGNQTLTLLEYRVENVCPSSCGAFSGTLSNLQRTVTLPPGYLLGGLSEVDGDGLKVVVFELDETGTNMVMTFSVRASGAGVNPFVVSRAPVPLQVAVRE